MVPDSEIRPYLELSPAQSLLDLLVALLHPHPQPASTVWSPRRRRPAISLSSACPEPLVPDVAQTGARDQPHVLDPDNPYGKFFS